ncbi:MAG: DUF11 domain-containing protein, partial [Intrasporangium sp.]|uniref:hypothetical protein n=1 Tax=Intrasporangium sp. TaxID=1925024 RepID=UPI002647AD45
TTGPSTTDVSVSLALSRNPGYVGGSGAATVTVTNRSAESVDEVQLTVVLPVTPTPTGPAPTGSAATGSAGLVTVGSPQPCFTGTACKLGPLGAGKSRTVTQVFQFAAAGTEQVTARVSTAVTDTAPADNVATVDLVVRQPVIRVLQPVVEPGVVTMAVGHDFPPGEAVTLAWSRGISTRPTPVAVRGDGTLTPTQILILPRDVLGSRDLVATAVDDGSFAPVQAAVLVAPGTVDPPADFVNRR